MHDHAEEQEARMAHSLYIPVATYTNKTAAVMVQRFLNPALSQKPVPHVSSSRLGGGLDYTLK